MCPKCDITEFSGTCTRKTFDNGSIIFTGILDDSSQPLFGIVEQIDGSSCYRGEVMVRNDGSNEFLERHGKGYCRWNSGDAYDGMWESNKKSGTGKHRFDSGVFHEGQWEDDKLHGKAHIVKVNGDKFDGHFQSGQMAGLGRITYKNGDKIDGTFDSNGLVKSFLFLGIGFD